MGESLIIVFFKIMRGEKEEREHTLLFCFIVKEKGGENDSKDGLRKEKIIVGMLERC